MFARRSLHRFIPLVGILALPGLAGVAVAQQPGAPPPKSDFKSLKDKASYAIGLSIGRGMKEQSLDVSLDLISRGMVDGLGNGKALLTDQEAKDAMEQFQQEIIGKVSDQNKREGAAFLTANGKKPDIKTTASGLQYKVIKMGNGPKPTAEDTVTTNYRGTLVDGREFDSSYKRGEPTTFPVNRVIPGWTEALQLMPTGSKWQLYIPSNLAYGEEGRPPVIGPNAMLIFDLELLSVGDPGQLAPPRVRVKPQ